MRFRAAGFFMFKIECRYLGGWADAEWTESDKSGAVKPCRFATLEEANAEIDDFIADTAEAYKAGNLDAPYDRADFRAVSVT